MVESTCRMCIDLQLPSKPRRSSIQHLNSSILQLKITWYSSAILEPFHNALVFISWVCKSLWPARPGNSPQNASVIRQPWCRTSWSYLVPTGQTFTPQLPGKLLGFSRVAQCKPGGTLFGPTRQPGGRSLGLNKRCRLGVNELDGSEARMSLERFRAWRQVENVSVSFFSTMISTVGNCWNPWSAKVCFGASIASCWWRQAVPGLLTSCDLWRLMEQNIGVILS